MTDRKMLSLTLQMSHDPLKCVECVIPDDSETDFARQIEVERLDDLIDQRRGVGETEEALISLRQSAIASINRKFTRLKERCAIARKSAEPVGYELVVPTYGETIQARDLATKADPVTGQPQWDQDAYEVALLKFACMGAGHGETYHLNLVPGVASTLRWRVHQACHPDLARCLPFTS